MQGLAAAVVLQPLVCLIFAAVIGIGRLLGHLVPIRAQHVQSAAEGRCLYELAGDGRQGRIHCPFGYLAGLLYQAIGVCLFLYIELCFLVA